MAQTESIFDFLYEPYKLKKPIRLIELFAGYGSQYLSLKYLGLDVEHYKIVEWSVSSIQAYNDLHLQDTTDYSSGSSKEEIVEYLSNKGVSTNHNEPLTKEQLKRKSSKWLRQVFNNIIATSNLVDINKVKGQDLGIVDKEHYAYVMTYSFPCQDLSLAGQGAGLGEGTRSGLLWQVERILSELHSLGQLPEILLMENVPMIVSKKYRDDLARWDYHLSSLGYKSYIKNLIATDFLIPQTRNRTFMLSILGDYSYQFPKVLQEKYLLKDLLESEVDEKYFISDKMLSYFSDMTNRNGFIRGEVFKPLEMDAKYAKTITTRAGNRPTDNFIIVPENTQRGFQEAYLGDAIYLNRPHQKRGTVQRGEIQTIKTRASDLGVVVEDKRNLKQKLADDLIESGTVKGGEIINHSYTNANKKANSRIELKDFIETDNGLMPTLTTRPDTLGVVVEVIEKPKLRIRKLTPKEAFRFMGLENNDIARISKQSDSALYHLAGDSIVIQVLMAIFGQLAGIDWEQKIRESLTGIINYIEDNNGLEN